MIAGKLLTLTSKGREELKTRVYKLDAMSRNILFLVDKGNATIEALRQRSLFPPETLMARIPQLVAERFLDDAGGSGPAEGLISSAAAINTRGLDALQLQPGVSLSQARFELCDFCLDHFGTRGQALVSAVNRCSELNQLQQVLDRIQAEVRQSLPDHLPALITCVSSINQSAP
jgi:hypothetical protein